MLDARDQLEPQARVKDLDDVRSTGGILNEVRARESMVDDYLGPVEDVQPALGVRVPNPNLT